jgi:integrase
VASRSGKPGFIHSGISVGLGLDGRLHAKVPVGKKPNGKPDRRHVSGPLANPGIIRLKIDKLLTDVARREVRKPGRAPTVAEWFMHWLTEIAPYAQRPLSAKSAESYESIYRTWFVPHIGGLRLDELEADSLDAMYAAMHRKGLARSSVLKAHAILRRALNVAVQRGRVHRNVAAGMDNPGSTKRRRKRALTRAQAAEVLKVVAATRNPLRWRLALALGLRQGEALGLRWAAVDLHAGTMSVDWQLQRQTYRHGCADPAACAGPHHRGECPRPPRWEHGCPEPAACTGRKGNELAEPKPAYCPQRVGTGECRRHGTVCPPACAPGCRKHAARCPAKLGGLVFARAKTIDADEDWDEADWEDEEQTDLVDLPPTLVRELKAHRAAQRQARLVAGQLWRDHDLVFCLDDGGPIDPRADLEDWHDILTRAGFKTAGTHLGRASAASIAREEGLKIEDIQDLLRHTDIRTTRGYVVVTAAARKRTAAAMDQALFGGGVTDIVTARRERRSRR